MKATRTHHDWGHMFITHRPTLTLRLPTFHLFRTCLTSSFCTVAWQLARFQLTRRIARFLGDSWAFCTIKRNSRCASHTHDNNAAYCYRCSLAWSVYCLWLSTLCPKKLSQKLTDFNDFWFVKFWVNLTRIFYGFVHLSTWSWEIQNSHFQQYYSYILLIFYLIPEENKL